MNIAIIVGNLGADPELRYTPNGNAVMDMSVATSTRINGEDKTEWHKVTVWGKTAESCANYLSKGSKVGIKGRIEYQKYEKDGETRYMTKIVADNVEFLSSKGEEDPF